MLSLPLPTHSRKFAEGNLREDDPFGYISQLSSYVYAAKDDPLVTNKTHGAFLVVDKVNGTICLDVYDFSKELEQKEKEIGTVKKMVKGKIPDRPFDPVPVSETVLTQSYQKLVPFCDFKRSVGLKPGSLYIVITMPI